MFADDAAAQTYIAKHTERLKTFGMTPVNVKLVDINEGLTRLTNGHTA